MLSLCHRFLQSLSSFVIRTAAANFCSEFLRALEISTRKFDVSFAINVENDCSAGTRYL